MSELWGVQAGQQAAVKDNDAHALNMLALGQGQQQMEETGLKIQQAELTLKNQSDMAKALHGMVSGTGGPAGQPTPADAANMAAGKLETAADISMGNGMLEEGKKYLQTASTIRKNQATLEESQSKIRQKDMDTFEKLESGIHDEQSWKDANMAFMMERGKPSPFANHPYDPGFVDFLRKTALNEKDKAKVDQEKASAKMDEAKAAESKARLPLIKAQTELDKSRDAALKKAGGAHLIPKAAEVSAVADLIKSEYGENADLAGSYRAVARPVAERVKAIMDKNPGMLHSAALKTAYKEAKDHGDFAAFDAARVAPGSSADKPMALPATAKSLNPGKWYKVTGSDGKTLPRFYQNGQLYTVDELAEINTKEKTEDDGEDEEDDE